MMKRPRPTGGKRCAPRGQVAVKSRPKMRTSFGDMLGGCAETVPLGERQRLRNVGYAIWMSPKGMTRRELGQNLGLELLQLNPLLNTLEESGLVEKRDDRVVVSRYYPRARAKRTAS